MLHYQKEKIGCTLSKYLLLVQWITYLVYFSYKFIVIFNSFIYKIILHSILFYNYYTYNFNFQELF